MSTIKLADYARKKKVTWLTAYRWYKAGKINAEKLPGGSIIVYEEDEKELKTPYTVVYARVSSSEQRFPNLDTQADRVTQFCYANGWIVDKVVKEVGSGLNDNRSKLIKILKDDKPTRIVVEHKDRLTRFGFNYLDVLLERLGVEIVVINQSTEDRADLIQDFISIIASFCSRIYGQRRVKRKTEQIIKELTDENTQDTDS